MIDSIKCWVQIPKVTRQHCWVLLPPVPVMHHCNTAQSDRHKEKMNTVSVTDKPWGRKQSREILAQDSSTATRKDICRFWYLIGIDPVEPLEIWTTDQSIHSAQGTEAKILWIPHHSSIAWMRKIKWRQEKRAGGKEEDILIFLQWLFIYPPYGNSPPNIPMRS